MVSASARGIGDDRRQTVAGFDQENRWLAHRSGPASWRGYRHDAGRQWGQARGQSQHVAPGQGMQGKSGSSGVHDARISISAVGGSPAIAPNDSEATRVTVPLAAV